jgi:hypothetical protein
MEPPREGFIRKVWRERGQRSGIRQRMASMSRSSRLEKAAGIA